MDKIKFDRTKILYRKIKDKTATKAEKEEYMRIMRDEGLISDEQYKRYVNGQDNDWLIALAILVGAAFIVWGVNQINKS